MTNELNVYLKNYYFLFSHLKKIKIKLKVSSTDYKPTLQSFLSSYRTQKLAGKETMSVLGDAAKAALVTVHATAHFTLNHCSQVIFH